MGVFSMQSAWKKYYILLLLPLFLVSAPAQAESPKSFFDKALKTVRLHRKKAFFAAVAVTLGGVAYWKRSVLADYWSKTPGQLSSPLNNSNNDSPPLENDSPQFENDSPQFENELGQMFFDENPGAIILGDKARDFFSPATNAIARLPKQKITQDPTELFEELALLERFEGTAQVAIDFLAELGVAGNRFFSCFSLERSDPILQIEENSVLDKSINANKSSSEPSSVTFIDYIKNEFSAWRAEGAQLDSNDMLKNYDLGREKYRCSSERSGLEKDKAHKKVLKDASELVGQTLKNRFEQHALKEDTQTAAMRKKVIDSYGSDFSEHVRAYCKRLKSQGFSRADCVKQFELLEQQRFDALESEMRDFLEEDPTRKEVLLKECTEQFDYWYYVVEAVIKKVFVATVS